MARLFWLDDVQWTAVEPHLPENPPGARRVDDLRLISGIIHGLKSGCRWWDCPPEYGPPTKIQNSLNRGLRPRFWTGLLEALAPSGAATRSASIDSSSVKDHRAAHGREKSSSTLLRIMSHAS